MLQKYAQIIDLLAERCIQNNLLNLRKKKRLSKLMSLTPGKQLRKVQPSKVQRKV
jgi:hypothetical protein